MSFVQSLFHKSPWEAFFQRSHQLCKQEEEIIKHGSQTVLKNIDDINMTEVLA